MLGRIVERVILGAQSVGAAPDSSARGAVQLLQVAVVALALVLVLVALLVVLAVLRRTRPAMLAPKGRATVASDAWSEAGKRAEPATRFFAVAGEGEAGEPGSEGDAVAVRNAQSFPDGKKPVVIITGGARRVGRAIAEAFAHAGCDLVITYRSSADAAARAADELCQLGIAVHVRPLDLGDPNAVERAGDELARDLPRADVLVHNASIYRRTPLEKLTAAAAEEAWRIHALGPLLLTRSLAGRLRESSLPSRGSVVAMLDVHALGQPRPEYSAYSMSKAALAEMVRSLARELAPRVRVNGVAPGVVAWPETGPESGPGAQRDYLARVPLERAGTPEDAAGAVRWLALDAAYITGQIVRVDGGRFMT